MSEVDSSADSSPDGNMNIRRATGDDIEALIEICRIIFPNYLIWCTNCCARRWWESVIRSKSHETWVYQLNNEIIALVRLVTDANRYKKEIQKLRPRFGTLLCVFIVRPRLLFGKILETIARMISSRVSYSDSSGLNSLVNQSMWFHSIAVLPNMRGKGIGTSMMCFCEQRAIELGFDSVKCFVKTNNNVSIRFHERLGFIRTGKIKDHYSFIKLLSKNHSVTCK
jgi:ribosomal protein S18 acetylase RimI-like enzyme